MDKEEQEKIRKFLSRIDDETGVVRRYAESLGKPIKYLEL